jgi:hypothetical protein
VLSLGGLSFAVEPEGALSAAEKQSLARLGADRPANPASGLFRIQISPEPLAASRDPADQPERAPALVEWVDDRVLLTHRQFAAELDPARGSGRLFRRTEDAFPLEITLRVALASRLPLEGGLPLHAAGILMNGRGLAFFGPSGAGKSTLASLSPYPVLSDELLAVVPGRPFDVMRTGFWGTLGAGDAPPGAFPLQALIELDQGPRFELTRLSPRAALRRLLGVIMVPVGPPLWTAALAAAGALLKRVPAYRMTWSPAAPPWDDLKSALA